MSWQPQRAVERGVLMPCGSNIDGSIREFFVNPEDVEELLRDGVTVHDHGAVVHYKAQLTATPYYDNGDVQIRLHEA